MSWKQISVGLCCVRHSGGVLGPEIRWVVGLSGSPAAEMQAFGVAPASPVVQGMFSLEN